MSKKSANSTPETPPEPPTAATPATPPPAAAPVGATSTKSGKGKVAVIAGGAAAIGLVIGLGIGWLGFGDGHHGRRHDQPTMRQQMPGGRGQVGGDDQMPQGRGGRAGGGQMMPGGRGQQMPNGPQSQGDQFTPNAPGGTTQQTPQTLPGAVAPN